MKNEFPQDDYVRRARVDRINYDGDTLRFQIDHGRSQQANEVVRLQGVDSPEVNSSNPLEREAGKAARDYVTLWLWAERSGHGLSESKPSNPRNTGAC